MAASDCRPKERRDHIRPLGHSGLRWELCAGYCMLCAACCVLCAACCVLWDVKLVPKSSITLFPESVLDLLDRGRQPRRGALQGSGPGLPKRAHWHPVRRRAIGWWTSRWAPQSMLDGPVPHQCILCKLPPHLEFWFSLFLTYFTLPILPSCRTKHVILCP